MGVTVDWSGVMVVVVEVPDDAPTVGGVVDDDDDDWDDWDDWDDDWDGGTEEPDGD